LLRVARLMADNLRLACYPDIRRKERILCNYKKGRFFALHEQVAIGARLRVDRKYENALSCRVVIK